MAFNEETAFALSSLQDIPFSTSSSVTIADNCRYISSSAHIATRHLAS